jgi:hypothetical protein
MLPKLENELDLDEDELELKGEAAELEPFFSRGDPIPVPRPAPNTVYLGDLEDELEEEAAELEPIFSQGGALERLGQFARGRGLYDCCVR